MSSITNEKTASIGQLVQVKNIFFTKIHFLTQFKILVEVLAGVVEEVTCSITAQTPPETPDMAPPFAGFIINTFDPCSSIYVKVELNLVKDIELTNFYCKLPKLDIGINLQAFNYIIKNTKKDRELSMFISENNRQKLTIVAETTKITDSSESGKIKRSELKLREPEQRQKSRKNQEYMYEVIMKNEDFHSICREYDKYSEHIEINCTSNNIVFKCIGDEVETGEKFRNGFDGVTIRTGDIFKETKNADGVIEEQKPCIYQGIFDIKNIILFSKCVNLGTNIILFLTNDFPLTMRYDFCSYGKMTVFIAPIKDNEVSNKDYNYGGDESDDEIIVKGTSKNFV